jgi:hypothetical protein
MPTDNSKALERAAEKYISRGTLSGSTPRYGDLDSIISREP